MLLEKLTQLTGVSGREQKVVEFIKEELKDYADEMTVDALGNLIALKKGNGANPKKIMASAHIDEIGLCVVAIDDKGFIQVRNMGGVSVFTSHAQRVLFDNGTIGTVVLKSNPLDIKENKMSHMFIDIGATSKEDAMKYVRVGDMACFMGEFTELKNDRVMSKAFDDRVGAYILIESMKELKDQYNDAYYVFTVQEEVGLRGATVAANRINPDFGIAVDITGSFDTPGCGNGNAVLGGGAAVKVMDGSVICDSLVVDTMVKLCENNEIKYQLDVLEAGGTDAGAMALSNDGVRTGGISIPTRNGHAPTSIIDMLDVRESIKLMTAFVNEEFNF